MQRKFYALIALFFLSTAAWAQTNSGSRKGKVSDKDTKETFKKHPAQMKLLIVVDKLLTGFDAPSATYLFIDKIMLHND
jgi:type I restriction enzyme R subunit